MAAFVSTSHAMQIYILILILSWLSFAHCYIAITTMPPTSPYATIKDRIASLATSLYNIPDSPVWIHEKQVHQLISLPSGPSFGPLNCLTLLLSGMKDGYWGNKKKGDTVQTNLPLADFEESSTYRI